MTNCPVAIREGLHFDGAERHKKMIGIGSRSFESVADDQLCGQDPLLAFSDLGTWSGSWSLGAALEWPNSPQQLDPPEEWTSEWSTASPFTTSPGNLNICKLDGIFVDN